MNLNDIQKAQNILDDVRGKPLALQQRCDKAVELAALLLNAARHHQDHSEKIHSRQMARLMKDPQGKAFIASLTDQCFRSRDSRRMADQVLFLIRKFGVPPFFSPGQRLQLEIFKWLGKPLSKVLVPLVKRMIRKETAAVIQPGEPERLLRHLKERNRQGIRINLNHLGEAILGEQEAQRRLKVYLDDLATPEVDYVSVKISTLYSQINLTAPDIALQILSERLKQLYRAARQNPYKGPDGRSEAKFVNLDMEEYHDLALTVSLFRMVLEDPEFQDYSAGIVLQSYLPDAFQWQQELTQWALQRAAKGGAPIKIRLVKGANLAMEQVEASLRNWPQAPYTEKSLADANFKHMLIYGSDPERAKAVHLGIGSHNLFDVAFALLLRSENRIEPFMSFEMLEGMAEPLRRAVQDVSHDMLLYCPVAREEEFQHAVAYLIRRLDENTALHNFLPHIFHLIPDTKEWEEQVSSFQLSCRQMESLPSLPRKTQNRLEHPVYLEEYAAFENEPDTDWSLNDNVEWAKQIRNEWSQKQLPFIPLVIHGQEIAQGAMESGTDPSFPEKTRFKYASGTFDQVNLLLDSAQDAHKQWSSVPIAKRSSLLAELARCFRKSRGDLIGAMMLNGGKTVHEADTEVSEAIDFAEYYRRNMEEVFCLQDVRWHSKGVVLLTPPWNFPCSIPAGGLIAALAAGNSVIFKPAPEAVLCGWTLANCFWDAGFEKDLVQFFPCPDEPVGSRLIEDPRVSSVLLTGSTQTARLFLQKRVEVDLIAETGGKNTLIITRMADRDLAVKDLLQSAFRHSGQKCSACSLALCEAEVYDDPEFRRILKDAAESLIVGPAWDLASVVIPLIKPAHPDLLRALTTLEEGEEWLLKPRQDSKNPQLWSPGIKWGVRAGSFTHQKELFGPVLGVMRADSLQHAIRMANGTPYGLTAGLHSLDEREQAFWGENIIAGNLYINRTITGAIVQRQPFGGCKESSFGRGAKAGGPNYLMQLMKAEQVRLPAQQDNLNDAVHSLHSEVEKRGYSNKQLALWNASVENYAYFWNHYFQKKQDPALLWGEDNFLQYVPHRQMTFRIQPGDEEMDVFRVIAAALTCGMPLEISGEAEKLNGLGQVLKIKRVEETEAQLVQRMKKGKVQRLRLLTPPSSEILEARIEAFCSVHGAPVLANGRIELLHYLREVCLSLDYHRYGYLGAREGEKRRPLPSPKPPEKKETRHLVASIPE